MTPLVSHVIAAIVLVTTVSIGEGTPSNHIPLTPADIKFATYGTSNTVDPPASVPVTGQNVQVMQKKAKKGDIYTTWGRALLDKKFLGQGRAGKDTTPKTQAFSKRIGLPGDEAGHIFAADFGYQGKFMWNIMPQARTVNRSGYKKVENRIKELLVKHGNLYMYVRGVYTAAGKDRPVQIVVFVRSVNNKFQRLWKVANPSQATIDLQQGKKAQKPRPTRPPRKPRVQKPLPTGAPRKPRVQKPRPKRAPRPGVKKPARRSPRFQRRSPRLASK